MDPYKATQMNLSRRSGLQQSRTVRYVALLVLTAVVQVLVFLGAVFHSLVYRIGLLVYFIGITNYLFKIDVAKY